MYKTKDLVIGSIIFVLLIIFVSYYFTSKNNFSNTPPYITQSLYINIYATSEDFSKYEWLFKGTLNNNIMVTDGTNYVFVPRTTVNIPIKVYNNSPQTKFTIQANGIEQEIQQCDFIATTF